MSESEKECEDCNFTKPPICNPHQGKPAYVSAKRVCEEIKSPCTMGDTAQDNNVVDE